MVETRRALIRAGSFEFAVHGLDTPSLDKICARAGYTRGAFYVHFKNRESFIVAVMASQLDETIGAVLNEIIGAVEWEAGLDPLASRYLAANLESMQAIPTLDASDVPNREVGIPLHRLLEASQRYPAVRDHLIRLLENGMQRVTDLTRAEQENGRFRSDVAPESIATLLLSSGLGAVTAFEAGLRLDSRKAGEDILRLLRPD
jgi:AcrR family transcriptional regulator